MSSAGAIPGRVRAPGGRTSTNSDAALTDDPNREVKGGRERVVPPAEIRTHPNPRPPSSGVSRVRRPGPRPPLPGRGAGQPAHRGVRAARLTALPGRPLPPSLGSGTHRRRVVAPQRGGQPVGRGEGRVRLDPAPPDVLGGGW